MFKGTFFYHLEVTLSATVVQGNIYNLEVTLSVTVVQGDILLLRWTRCVGRKEQDQLSEQRTALPLDQPKVQL